MRLLNWMVGTHIPLWGRVLVLLVMLVALFHWSHIIKWCVKGDIWEK